MWLSLKVLIFSLLIIISLLLLFNHERNRGQRYFPAFRRMLDDLPRQLSLPVLAKRFTSLVWFAVERAKKFYDSSPNLKRRHLQLKKKLRRPDPDKL